MSVTGPGAPIYVHVIIVSRHLSDRGEVAVAVDLSIVVVGPSTVDDGLWEHPSTTLPVPSNPNAILAGVEVVLLLLLLWEIVPSSLPYLGVSS